MLARWGLNTVLRFQKTLEAHLVFGQFSPFIKNRRSHRIAFFRQRKNLLQRVLHPVRYSLRGPWRNIKGGNVMPFVLQI